MNGELSSSLICRIRPTNSLFSFMAEISPHQGTKSQWIEALLFLPISEILSLTCLGNCGRPRLHLPRNRDFLQFPLTSFLASSFFSGTSRNRAGSKNNNKPIKHMFPCSRHSRSKASRPPASLCGLFMISSSFLSHQLVLY